MKRAAALVVSSLVSVLPFAACDDTATNTATPTPTNDASFTPEGSMPGVDGAIPQGQDAGQDAPAGDTATVVVTKGGAPDPGVSVVFHDAAGAAIATAITGADGKATHAVTNGGQITVALGAAGTRQLLTYVGVKAGDVLDVVERTTRPVSVTAASGNPGGPITVVLGNFNCSTNAASAGTYPMELTPECITGAKFPVIAKLDYNLQTYYSFKKDIPLAATGTTTVTGMSAWAPGTAFTLDITNAPNLTNPQAFLGQIANDQSFAIGSSAIALEAGGASPSFVVAGGYADAYQGELQFVNFIPSGFQQVVSFSKRIPAGVTTQALDLAGGLLPSLLGATATNATPARPVVTWTASGALSGADSGVVTLPFSNTIDAGGAESLETVEWTFIVPPGTLTVTAPQLPSQLAAFAPSAASTLNQPSVAFFESDLVPSYDFVRGHAAAFGLTKVPIGIFAGALIPALPASGTVRVTAIAPGG
ncbi:MAG: hypothetical protein JWP87_2224 [Labilithrix sp.]|nr:hypothetical protein [Labilithrix sp.]